MAVGVEHVARDAVTVIWKRPTDTGGVPLSGYVLEVAEGKSTR